MSRLTITLSDERHRALREAAARSGRTIGQLIDESLEFYGVKGTDAARSLVASARARARMAPRAAQELAIREVRAQRRR